LMKLPGDTVENFLLFQPFVPYSAQDQRKELSAFLAAKSDPDEYGRLQAFVMPRNQQIDGPALAEARIQQNEDIKRYITLLNQSGSNVKLGNMLIIPVENSLIYVRPLYITARQTQVPEFKKAIVVHNGRTAMEDTLQQSLARLFGAAPATQEQQRDPVQADGGTSTNPDPTAPSTTTTTSTSTTVPGSVAPSSIPPDQVQALLNQANDEFRLAADSLRNGDLAAYQNHVRRAEELVRQARGA
jgi:uncharacterized protein